MRSLHLILLCSLLFGCRTHSVLTGSGEIAPTPVGHDIACIKNPTLAGCPK